MMVEALQIGIIIKSIRRRSPKMLLIEFGASKLPWKSLLVTHFSAIRSKLYSRISNYQIYPLEPRSRFGDGLTLIARNLSPKRASSSRR